jgi:hypothetical protein
LINQTRNNISKTKKKMQIVPGVQLQNSEINERKRFMSVKIFAFQLIIYLGIITDCRLKKVLFGRLAVIYFFLFKQRENQGRNDCLGARVC